MADKEEPKDDSNAVKDEERDSNEALAAGDSESAESEESAQENVDGSRESEPEAGRAKAAPATGGGLDTRWIGYVGGLAIVGISLVNITGERNMFAPKEVSAESAAAEVADGPCAQWKQQLCEAMGGDKAQACTSATSAVELLTDEACKLQLRALETTVTELQAARADCQKLMDRLCGDLGADSAACQLVKSRTPTFPAERCTDMLGKYDKVLDELRQIEARGGIPGATKPGGPAAGPRRGAAGGVDPHAGHNHPPGAHPGSAASPPKSGAPAGAATDPGGAAAKPAVVNAGQPASATPSDAPKVVPAKATATPTSPASSAP